MRRFLHALAVIKKRWEFIKHLIERGESNEKKASGPAIWNEFLQDDAKIRQILKHYPNGPLLKTLDLFRESAAHEGFDPLSQENFPSQLYTLTFKDFHLTTLRIPAPVHQEIIDKVEVAPEFRGFLRALQTQMHGQRHLLFNLQDRTSWQEHARCSVLEKMQNEAEFAKVLTVITICKNTDFYNQTGPYQMQADAAAFISSFIDQIASGEASGYFFPPSLNKQEINAFTSEALELIHKLFFSSEATLSRKQRMDFIEIFYQFLFMKLIQMVKPDSMSFTCKDAIDIGESTAAGFFAFLKMLEGKAWGREDKEFFLWMLYSPALTIRERPIDSNRLLRIVNASSIIQTELESHRKAILEQVHKLLGQLALREIELKPAA